MAQAVSQVQPQEEVSLARVTGFSGPIPEPDTLAGYGRIDPTFPVKIMAMAEAEQKHRHDREMLVAQKQTDDWSARRHQIKHGQNCATVVCLVAIVGGTVAACFGFQWAASIIGGGGLAGVITSFVYQGTQPKQQDLSPPQPGDSPTGD